MSDEEINLELLHKKLLRINDKQNEMVNILFHQKEIIIDLASAVRAISPTVQLLKQANDFIMKMYEENIGLIKEKYTAIRMDGK